MAHTTLLGFFAVIGASMPGDAVPGAETPGAETPSSVVVMRDFSGSDGELQ
jgi:hypothetical protein